MVTLDEVRACRPHDLLWLRGGAVVGDAPPPVWALHDKLAGSPVVVRRAMMRPVGLVPVGLRGLARHERWAAWAPVSQIVCRRSPEDVLAAWLAGPPSRVDLPCLCVLDALATALRGFPLRWGVAGGAAFMLASGLDVLHAGSDLDLLVRAPLPGDASALRDLAVLTQRRDTRVDVQVEAPAGGFAMLEWLRTGGPVLMKTAQGPVLVEDPWSLPAG